jgi:predicted small metal-binding protein
LPAVTAAAKMSRHPVDLDARCEMAYSLRCADSGMDCPGQFTTKTEDELMKHVELHVGEAHPDMELTAENVEMVKGLVRAT